MRQTLSGSTDASGNSKPGGAETFQAKSRYSTEVWKEDEELITPDPCYTSASRVLLQRAQHPGPKVPPAARRRRRRQVRPSARRSRTHPVQSVPVPRNGVRTRAQRLRRRHAAGEPYGPSHRHLQSPNNVIPYVFTKLGSRFPR
jgi:hypothetical protein